MCQHNKKEIENKGFYSIKWLERRQPKTSILFVPTSDRKDETIPNISRWFCLKEREDGTKMGLREFYLKEISHYISRLRKTS